MKKNQTIKQIILAAVAVFGFGVCAMAQTPDPIIFSATCSTGQTLRYRVTSTQQQTVMVTYIEYSNNHGDDYSLEIPDQVRYDGITYRVSAIKEEACWDHIMSLFSLTIPWSIDSIGKKAFNFLRIDTVFFNAKDCHVELTPWGSGIWGHVTPEFVYLGDSVRRVNRNVFRTSGGSYVRELYISNSVLYIGDSAFYYNNTLEKIVSKAVQAPALGSGTFVGYTPPELVVPCGSSPDYIASDWNSVVSSISEDCNTISENENNFTKAYPNPTDGTFAIEAENITNVEIFDLAGQKVLTDRSGNQTINAGSLPTGVYFLKAETTTETKYGKLIKK